MKMIGMWSMVTGIRRVVRRHRRASDTIAVPAKGGKAHVAWKRRLLNEDGQNLVETSLVILTVLVFFIAIMEACMAFYTYHAVAEIAHQATRWAIVRGSTCDGALNDCPATADDVTSYVQGLNYPLINTANLKATATWPDGGNAPGDLVKVQVEYDYTLSSLLLPTTKFPIYSTSEMTIAY